MTAIPKENIKTLSNSSEFDCSSTSCQIKDLTAVQRRLDRKEVKLVEPMQQGPEKIEVRGMHPQDIQRIIQQQIFRPQPPEGKIKIWIKRRMQKWMIESSSGAKRFNRVHKLLKIWIGFPMLKFIHWYLKKDVIKSLDDIPNEPHNAHIRMFYWCMEKALQDMWEKMYWAADPNEPGSDKQGRTARQFYEYTAKTNKSHIFRSLAFKIWVTEMLEDTVDREWCNFFCSRMTEEMNLFYEGQPLKSGEFPIYMAPTGFNPAYFLKFAQKKRWQPPKEDTVSGTAKV